MESLTAEDLASGRAEHPYTRALVAAVPHVDAVQGTEFAHDHRGCRVPSTPSGGVGVGDLAFENVGVRYGHGPAAHQAVRGVSLHVPSGRTVGLVGE